MSSNMLEREQAIAKIDSISNEIRGVWSDLNSYEVNKISEVWNDPVAMEYIGKVQNVDNTINKIISNLEMLKDCWKKEKIDDSEGEGNNE